MAVQSTSNFQNAIVGQMQVGADVDIYQSDSTAKYSVGQGFTRSDGAKFRYAHFGAATNRGVVVAHDFSESSLADSDNNLDAPATAGKPPNENINAGDIGSHYIQVDSNAVSATNNQFAGAHLVITDDTGEGYTYRIKGNTADGSPSAGRWRLELYEPITVAIDGTSDIAIVGSIYANLETATALPTDQNVAGVAVTSNSATNYGWVQTHGVCGVLQDQDVPSLGDQVFLSTTDNGAVTVNALVSVTDTGAQGNITPLLGYCITPGGDTGHSSIYLTLE